MQWQIQDFLLDGHRPVSHPIFCLFKKTTPMKLRKNSQGTPRSATVECNKLREQLVRNISTKRPTEIRVNSNWRHYWMTCKFSQIWSKEAMPKQVHMTKCPTQQRLWINLQTRMHSRRMRTARSSSHPGGVHQATPGTSPAEEAPPLGADHTPQRRHHPLPPINRLTDACENITLPQLHCGW